MVEESYFDINYSRKLLQGGKDMKNKPDDKYKVNYIKKTVLKKFFSKNRYISATIYVLIVLAAFFSIGISLIMQKAIDTITSGASFSEFFVVIGISALFLCIVIILNFVNLKLKNLYAKKFSVYVKNVLFAKLLKKNIVEFENTDTGEYLSSFQVDMMRLVLNYLTGTWLIVNSIAVCLIGLASMFYLSVKLSLILLLLQLVPVIISLILGKKLVEYEKKNVEKRAEFVSAAQDYLKGFRLVKSFASEKIIFKRFSHFNKKYETAYKKYNDQESIITVLNEAFNYLMMICLFLFGGLAVINGNMTIGSIIAAFEILGTISGPFSALSVQMNMVRASNALFVRMYDLYFSKSKNEIAEQSAVNNDIKKIKISEQINIDNVSFSYDNEKYILENVNCKFEKNKKYAIVGNSGSGKSTLIKLLQGNYKNFDGKIFFDDYDIKTLNIDVINNAISIVQQDVFIFNATVWENITLFSNFEDIRIQNALEKAGLSEFISTHGLDYYCGENGKSLSGGEKQRISIARCLLRDSDVILFDEATAALDNLNSTAIENTILSLDKTCIVITHKLNLDLLRKYDKIFVFDKGTICESGTADELMSLKNKFYELYTAFEHSNNSN